MKDHYIFPKSDFKYQMWSAALKKYKVKTSSRNYYRFSFIWFLFFKSTSKDVVFFRYLNSQRKIEIVLKLLFEILITQICRLRAIRVAWIVHNVDAESHDAWLVVTKCRRRLIARSALKIFVTDKLLITHAKFHLPSVCEKLDYICFGPYEETGRYGESSEHIIPNAEDWLAAQKRAGRVIGASVTSPAVKNNQAQIIETLLADEQVAIFAMGDIGNLAPNERLFYCKKNTQVGDNFWSNFDFTVKGSQDKSVLISGYLSARLNIPMVTKADTFFSYFIEYYNLGVNVPKVTEGIFKLNLTASIEGKAFLGTNNWDVAAKRMYDALRISG